MKFVCSTGGKLSVAQTHIDSYIKVIGVTFMEKFCGKTKAKRIIMGGCYGIHGRSSKGKMKAWTI